MATRARPELVRLLWLSVVAAIATITLKTLAWALTGSVGLLSDAAESLVNLAAALFARWPYGPPRVRISPPPLTSKRRSGVRVA
jgi:Co/Zn/Cd efflux system component